MQHRLSGLIGDAGSTSRVDATSTEPVTTLEQRYEYFRLIQDIDALEEDHLEDELEELQARIDKLHASCNTTRDRLHATFARQPDQPFAAARSGPLHRVNGC